MRLASRRNCLLLVPALHTLATSSLAGRLPNPTKPQNGIIDAHVHVWTPDTERYPLSSGFRPNDFWFPSFTVEELLQHCRPLGVTRFNLVQMTWYGLDHRYILDTIAKDPRHFVGTGIVPAVTDVAFPSPDRTMQALANAGIVAFRIRGRSARPPFGDGPQWLDHPGYQKIFQAGAEQNLALSFLMGPPDLPELNRMCTQFPDTPVIIDHMGGIGRQGNFPEEEIAALCQMAKHQKVMVKVGAFWNRGSKQPPHLEMLPLVRRIVDAFGPKRCMWESASGHFPLGPAEQRYKAGLELIRNRADFLSQSDKEQILFRTAENFFFGR